MRIASQHLHQTSIFVSYSYSNMCKHISDIFLSFYSINAWFSKIICKLLLLAEHFITCISLHYFSNSLLYMYCLYSNRSGYECDHLPKLLNMRIVSLSLSVVVVFAYSHTTSACDMYSQVALVWSDQKNSHIYMLLISSFFIFYFLLINITLWKKNPSIKLSSMINGATLAWEMGNANDWSI